MKPLLLSLLVIAGCAGRREVTRTHERPDAIAVASAEWLSLPPMPRGPRQDAGVALVGDEVWVVGGFDGNRAPTARVEIFDTVKRAWRDGPALPEPLHHANVAAVNGRLFVLGALRGKFEATGVALELKNGGWVRRMSMPVGTERGAAGVAVLDDKIFVLGGYRGGARGDVSIYDSRGDSWTTAAPLSAARDHLVAAGHGGKVFAIGGRNNSTLDGRVDVYDVKARTWSSGAPMLTPRAACAAAQIGGRVIVVGGEGGPTGVFANAELYDIASDTWRSLPAMPVAKHAMSGVAVGDTAYFPGGATREGFAATERLDALRIPLQLALW